MDVCDGYDAPFEARSIIMSERGTIATTTITQYNDDSDGGDGGGAGGRKRTAEGKLMCFLI
jgi:hypothetical protein